LPPVETCSREIAFAKILKKCNFISEKLSEFKPQKTKKNTKQNSILQVIQYCRKDFKSALCLDFLPVGKLSNL